MDCPYLIENGTEDGGCEYDGDSVCNKVANGYCPLEDEYDPYCELEDE